MHCLFPIESMALNKSVDQILKDFQGGGTSDHCSESNCPFSSLLFPLFFSLFLKILWGEEHSREG